jgi:hypothetical protein
MDPDKYQQAWRAQSSRERVAVDADLLLQEVRRSERAFRATIFWRDFREIGVALLMIPLWFYLGARHALPWTWYLTVPVLVWIAGFMLVYRMRHKQRPGQPDEPLLPCVKRSLAEVEAQIWLLRNIFWWYLLPPTLSISAFFAHVVWLSAVATNDWLAALVAATFLFGFLFGIYAFVYYLNQRAVRTQLEPRRQELLALLASLQDESTGAASGKYPILTSQEGIACSRRRWIVVGLLLLIGLGGILIANSFVERSLDQRHAKKSPFAAVRWQESQPEVEVKGQWFKLLSLDGIPAAEIVAFSQETYGDLWQKRFEEDLVELLSRMGRPPGSTVTLTVQSLATSQTRVLEDVPLTAANRTAIREAARARAGAEH